MFSFAPPPSTHLAQQNKTQKMSLQEITVLVVHSLRLHEEAQNVRNRREGQNQVRDQPVLFLQRHRVADQKPHVQRCEDDAGLDEYASTLRDGDFHRFFFFLDDFDRPPATRVASRKKIGVNELELRGDPHEERSDELHNTVF